jgi:hypothetical protein
VDTLLLFLTKSLHIFIYSSSLIFVDYSSLNTIYEVRGGETIPGFLYHEDEVVERKTDVHIMGNGTVTAGAKYIDDPNVRIDIIIVRKDANIPKGAFIQTQVPCVPVVEPIQFESFEGNFIK